MRTLTPSPVQEGCFYMNKSTARVVLFVNGELPAPDHVQAQLTNNDMLIAVDGGLRHIESLGLSPNLIIGDLDSADPEKIQAYHAQGVETKTFPADKDETDLELALQAACELEPETIWVVAALGNRLDQTLANIFLLTLPDLVNFNIRLFDGQTEVFLIRESGVIQGEIGQRVSLLPIHGLAEGIYTEGLKYTLSDETLYPEKTRGISNEMSSSTATVHLKNGLLLCIRETTKITERFG